MSLNASRHVLNKRERHLQISAKLESAAVAADLASFETIAITLSQLWCQILPHVWHCLFPELNVGSGSASLRRLKP